jgi:hypothetical protein
MKLKKLLELVPIVIFSNFFSFGQLLVVPKLEL